jgi:twitching motility protein PilT
VEELQPWKFYYVREDKIANINSCIQTGAAVGMQTLDQHLKLLVDQKLILKDTALEVTHNKVLF